jgi:rhodanese-related sulfurtransferase
MGYRKTIKEIIILVGIAAVLGLAANFVSPRGIAMVGQWDPAKGVVTANTEKTLDSGISEIQQVKVAREIFDRGDVLFVDARSKQSYEAGHIPGAVSLPVGAFDEQIGSFLNRYSPAQPIVTYCSGRACEDSHSLARMLTAAGYSNIRVFIDGFPAWEAEGYPVE